MGDSQQQPTDSKNIMDAIQDLVAGATKMAGGDKTPSGGPVVTPGQIAPGPPPNIQFNPSGTPGAPIQTAAPRQVRPFTPTGDQSIGHFATRNAATNAGMVSLGNSLGSLFSDAGKRAHDKKAGEAEGYLTQINALLASGDPGDREQAQKFLDDPKVRKTLKTGLDYVPLEEEKPPEAQGVETALQKIKAKQQGGNQPQQKPPPPQMQAALPHASQADQIKSAIQSAILQKIKNDPASALAMGGASSLSASEQHATQFYEAGLGMTPVQVAAMTQSEKLQGMKMYESVMKDSIRAQVDIYKADQNYKGKIDTASILAKSRDRMTDAVKAAKDKKGAAANYAAGAKVYADLSKQYMDIVKAGKGKNGQPLNDQEKKYYEDRAREYQQKADDLLNETGNEDLWNMFMKSMAVGGEDTPDEDKEDNKE